MNKTIQLTIFSLLFSFSMFAQEEKTPKPNIVLILADDVALMDFGVYGGEASTPNIDKLATSGTMFTNYHASPMCAPSRAMLMTGYDSHLTGVPNLPLFLPPEYAAKPAYKGILNNKVKTLATHLKEEGYRTYMTGKWHLGHTETTLPSKRGFDRTFILDASGADNYEHKAYLPTQSKPPWYQDGEPVDLPEDFYSSRNLVDKMIEFMKEEKDKSNPFFSFLAFQAIHIPVQAPKEFIDKYVSVYDGGWHEMRQKRFENAKLLGLVSVDAKLGDMLPVLEQWENLTEETRKIASKRMAVNAGMLDAMDFHIGRYMAYLQESGELEKTVFIVTSDNGPEASDPSLMPASSLWMKQLGYNTDYETLGEKGSFGFIGPEFASAAAGPSAMFKFYAGEGGLRVPLIISGQNIPKGQKEKAFSFITGIVPTILDIVGSDAPRDEEMTGRSMYNILYDKDSIVYQMDENLGMEAASQAALYRGNMKLVYNGKPYGDATWRMYNLATDPGETNDLAETEAELFVDMMKSYEAYKEEFGVLEMPKDYEAVGEITNKLIRNLKKKAIPWLISFVVVLTGFIVWRRRRRKAKS